MAGDDHAALLFWRICLPEACGDEAWRNEPFEEADWRPGADKIAGSDFGPRAQRCGPQGEARGRASSIEGPACVFWRKPVDENLHALNEFIGAPGA